MSMTLEEMQLKRRLLGYSYADLAEKAGLPLSTVQKVFGGVTQSPRHKTMTALEEALQDGECTPAAPINRTDQTLIKEPSVTYGSAIRVKQQGEYTIEDYLALPDDVRYELIDGVLIKMDSPTRSHQSIAGFLFYKIYSYIEENGGDCTPYIAPLDVQLDKDDKTMLQPDVMIVCDHDVETDKRLFGAPDFVAEVLSPSTRRKDMIKKLQKYMDAGVREYWIIDPDKGRIITYLFGEGENDIAFASYSMHEDVPVGIYAGKCRINFSKVAPDQEQTV